MNIEEALDVLNGCLMETILNPHHEDENKRRVIEVVSDRTDIRICGYGATFEKAIIAAAIEHEKF